MYRRSAFSLVELSIVLVILGLLVGGILAGQSLIRAAELRSIASDYQRYITAVYSFQEQYAGLPGDLANATAVWGHDSAAAGCTNRTGTSLTSPGTCDGNNDRVIVGTAAALESGEVFQFWRHLSLAGLIEGNYSGLAGASGTNHAIAGQNVPAGKLSNSAWYAAHYASGYAGGASILAGYYGNFLFIGRQSANAWPSATLLTPEEAWNIDVKMDDGKPAQGKVITFWWDDCGTGLSQSDFTADYDLTRKTVSCTPVFREAF